jgi:multicomponent Na+:H+ antiporter subunit G
MSDVIATIAVVLGATLGLLSAVGILRMPDVYIRLQVASKASSLGIALLMLGVAAHFGELSVTVRALLVVIFLFLTAPVAAHVIGRAAYLTGVPLAASTGVDELAGAYDADSGRLAGLSGADEAAPGLDGTAPVADEATPDPDEAAT